MHAYTLGRVRELLLTATAEDIVVDGDVAIVHMVAGHIRTTIRTSPYCLYPRVDRSTVLHHVVPRVATALAHHACGRDTRSAGAMVEALAVSYDQAAQYIVMRLEHLVGQADVGGPLVAAVRRMCEVATARHDLRRAARTLREHGMEWREVIDAVSALAREEADTP